MRAISSKNTSPELLVRRSLFALGYRYRIHVSGMPGRPDIVFPSRRKVIFVNGCFWHQHHGCTKGKRPQSNQEYWLPKLRRNRVRDRKNIADLQADGWRVLVVWECETDNLKSVVRRIRKFLE